MMTRQGPHEDEHRQSARVKGDRVNHRPAKLADYLHWLQFGYALETPNRLHESDLADDGAPDHTGEAKGFIGFTGVDHDRTHPLRQDRTCPTCEVARDKDPNAKRPRDNDWRGVACRMDDDGSYLTPMRCAIYRIPSDRRALVRDLATNLFTPLDVTRSHGIPDWCAGDVMHRSLTMLWSVYQERPVPRQGPGWVDKSDAQRTAEEAAA